MKVASVQMVSSDCVSDNLNVAGQLIEQAAQQAAELIVLPEFFCFMGHHDVDKLDIAEQPGEGPIQSALAKLASQHAVCLVAGTVPLKASQKNKVYNSSLVYGPSGKQIARYDKIHLFCYQSSSESYDESKVLEPGSQPVTVECGSVRVGLSTCYDLRFPELYRALLPADVLVVPSAFTYSTGKAHWELLLRARAVENQCCVIGSNQGGTHTNGRRTWGHSMVVDAWGKVQSCLSEGEGVVLADFDVEQQAAVRQRLPVLNHRVF